MCDRQESRPGEAIARAILKPIAKLCPTWWTTYTTTMAKAMVNCSVIDSNQKAELYDIAGILTLAGER